MLLAASAAADTLAPATLTRTGIDAFSLYDIGNVRGLDASRVVGNYRWNGLPVLNQARGARESTERYDVHAGLRALEAGFVYPGGIVDLTGKDASQRAHSFSAGASAAGSAYLAADIGGRGLRLNAARDAGDQAVPGLGYTSSFASLAGALQAGPNTWLRADVEWHKWSERGEQASVFLDGLTPPAAPAARTLLGQAWAGTQLTDLIYSLRLEQRLAPDWSLHIGAVRLDERVDDQDFFGRLLPGAQYELSYGRDAEQRYLSDTLQAALRGSARTGSLQHRLALGATAMHYSASVRGVESTVLGDASLYAPRAFDPVSLPAPGASFEAQRADDSRVWVSDSVMVSERLTVLAALRAGRYRQSGANVAQPADETYLLKSGGASYALGGSQQKARALLYASYGEAYEQGSTAPLGATNAERILPSYVTRQVEAGMRFSPMPRLELELAAYRAHKSYEYTDASDAYVQDGTLVQDGLEIKAVGEPAAGTRVYAAVLLLSTNVRGALDPAIEGRAAVDVPPARLKLVVEQAIAVVPGLAVHVSLDAYGDRAADAYGTARLPGYGILGAGAHLDLRVSGQVLALRLDIDNLADRSYWSGVGGGYLGLGGPRTVLLRAEWILR